jgi:hypothetical protein
MWFEDTAEAISPEEVRITNMTRTLLILSVYAGLTLSANAQTTTTLTLETANNTSACSSSTVPTYCNQSPIPDLTTATANTNAQTKSLTPVPGHVSSLTIENSYLYTGATTRIISAYQPWFAPQTGGTYNCYAYPSGGDTSESLHPCTGYSENNSATVILQDTTMHNLGFTDVSPDWYGNCNGTGCTNNQVFLNETVITEAADLASRPADYLRLMIMIDKGLIQAGMATSPYNSAAVGCPASSSATTACVITVLEAAYNYIDGYWGRKSYYSTDPVSGYPMTLTFIIEADFPDVDWTSSVGVWATVKAYMSKYTTPYKIVKMFGNFTETYIDGAYIWPQPLPYSNTASGSQFCYAWPGYTDGSCESYDYISSYYSVAKAAFTSDGAIQMGGLYIGFDGSNNNYNQNMLARQCGQLLPLLGDAVSTAGYSSSLQLPWLLVATWNDLGEATNMEGGVDNCWRVAAPTMVSSTVHWSLSATTGQSAYASVITVDHFRIWYGSGAGDLTLSQDNILASAHCTSGVTGCTFNLSDAEYPPPTGKTWYIYVEQIAKALQYDQINGGGNGNGAPVTYTP